MPLDDQLRHPRERGGPASLPAPRAVSIELDSRVRGNDAREANGFCQFHYLYLPGWQPMATVTFITFGLLFPADAG